jgi:hypothetical protein
MQLDESCTYVKGCLSGAFPLTEPAHAANIEFNFPNGREFGYGAFAGGTAVFADGEDDLVIACCCSGEHIPGQSRRTKDWNQCKVLGQDQAGCG